MKNFKEFSITIFNNKTGDILADIEADGYSFTSSNQPHFLTSWDDPNTELHAYTDKECTVEFYGECRLHFMSKEDRSPKMDRKKYV